MTEQHTYGSPVGQYYVVSTAGTPVKTLVLIPQDESSCWMYDVSVVGQDSAGAISHWRVVSVVHRVGAAAPSQTTEDIMAKNLGVGGSAISVTLTGNSFLVQVTGPAGNMNWTATLNSLTKIDTAAP
jgi:hypothetical protein